MSETIRYRCNNCGERFEAEILSADEKREYERENRPYSAVRCPSCYRYDLRKGWD